MIKTSKMASIYRERHNFKRLSTRCLIRNTTKTQNYILTLSYQIIGLMFIIMIMVADNVHGEFIQHINLILKEKKKIAFYRISTQTTINRGIQ